MGLTKLTTFATRGYCSKVTSRQAELMARSLPKRAPIPNVKDIVVVASGKGGVGKSTTAVNLSVTLASMGKRVGLLDADVFGPSVPLMMNISEEPLIDANNLMIPPINYGVKCLSMGLLVQSGPIVWRGPLVMSALHRLLRGANWGPLDVLVVDTPPGTGDIHLSLSQNVPLSGVLLVTTPQVAALDVTVRGAEMYKKFGVPLIGLAENMRHVICTNCKSKIEIFRNVTEKYAKDLGVDVLASIPIDGAITECCDMGTPMALKEPDSEYARQFLKLGDHVLTFLERRSKG